MRARTDKEKRAIIERLYHVWIQFPELRFGQLISNSFTRNPDPYYVEDGDFANRIEEYAKNVSEHSKRIGLA